VRSPVKRRTVPKHSQTRTLKEPPCQGGWINLRVCYAQNTASLFSLSLSLPCPVLVPVASWLPLVVFVVTMYSRCRLAHAVTSQDSASHCVESCTKTGRTFMVWCEGPCQSWYHPSCLGQTQSKVEDLSTWRCPPCLNSRPVESPSKRRKVTARKKPKQKQPKKEKQVLCIDGEMHSWAELDVIEANDASATSPTKEFSS
jgi:hypothetical protein